MTDTRPHPAIGRTEVAQDRIDLRQAQHMQLTLDLEPDLAEGDPLPPFWHYLYFNPQIRASDLAADGHETLGRFLPDLGLPRRMWAGGKLDWHRPLTLGTHATKTTTIRDVVRKTGRSGALGFVTVTHDFADDAGLCFTETQNIVYREAPAPDAAAPTPQPAPDDAQFQTRIDPDPVLLFRYSALIFYGHRIHYDADYTRDVEGYPGLIVHGPLTATLLMGFGLDEADGRTLASVEIRAIRPLFAPDPFWLEGAWRDGVLDMWARSDSGALSMRVTLHFAD